MILGRLTAAQKFTIYQPRWHDRVALLADYKIGTHNEITFPKSNTLKGAWYISGKQAKEFPLEQLKTKAGGLMGVRAVPLDALEPLERE